MKNLSIFINGMHCGSCVVAVRQALEEVAGVHTCDVRVGGAEVTFDSSVANKTELLAAIRAAGSFEIRGFSVE